MSRFLRALLAGLLAAAGAIGVVAFIAWAAIPQGSSVLYTGSDVVTMPAGTTFSGQILNALGTFTSSASFNLAGILTPSQITANQNNYSPTNLATANFLRLSSDASRDITGLATGTSGRVVMLHNVGSQNIILRAESGSSTDLNRFAMPSDLTLQANAMVVLHYDNTSQRWRTISPTLTGGPLNAATLTLQQQGSDAATPSSGNWVVYSKSTGIFTRDSAGNVYGPFGTGGGGGGTGITTVRVATTADITLSGTQTIDGVSSIGTAGEVVLVKNQSTATQNGIYVSSSGTWTRSTSFDTSGEFVAGFPVYVQSGTANGGTVWNFSVVGSFTLGSTDVTFGRTGLGPTGELLANKDAASGYAGLTAGSKIKALELLDYAAHSALAAANTINPTISGVLRTIVGIEGSGGAVTLTSNPEITAGTSAGQLLMLVGTHATNTVTLTNGTSANTGVRLCGNTGTLTVGLSGPKPIFQWNATLSVWEQLGCQDLQGAYNVNKTILGATDLASAVKICDTVNGNCLNFFGSTIQGTNAGAAIDSIIDIASGKDFIFKGNGTEFERTTAAGVQSFSNAGKPFKSIYIPAGAFETDQSICSDPVRDTVNGAPKQTISCSDPGSDTAALYTDVLMPTSWDGGTVRVTVEWFSASNLSAQHVDTDWNGFCIRDNDAVLTHNTTGVQIATLTFGNQTNDLQLVTTSAITLNGTCAGGAHLFLQGRMLSATTATMTNTRFLGIKLIYAVASRSD